MNQALNAPRVSGTVAGTSASTAEIHALSGTAADLLDTLRTTIHRLRDVRDRSRVSNSGGTPDLDAFVATLLYCYLRGNLASTEVARCVDTDALLRELHPFQSLRAEEIRHFRRQHRQWLTDCLAHALAALDARASLSPAPFDGLHLQRHPVNFGYWEPYYLQARECLQRSVELDSMALDE